MVENTFSWVSNFIQKRGKIINTFSCLIYTFSFKEGGWEKQLGIEVSSHNSPHPNILLEPSCCIITYTSLSSLWKKWDQHAKASKIKNHDNEENRRTSYLSSWTVNLLVKIWDFPSRPLTEVMNYHINFITWWVLCSKC